MKTIHEWHDQGLPIASRGSPGKPNEYDTLACINWLVNREVSKVMSERPQDRLSRVQADKIEMENTERRQLLIPIEQLEPKLRAALIAARELRLGAMNPNAWRVISPANRPGDRELLVSAFDGFLVKLSRWPLTKLH